MAVDGQLIDEIRLRLATGRGLRELSARKAHRVTEHTRARFVRDGDSVWWWESLSREPVVLPYGDGDGLEMLRCLVPRRGLVRMVATDDEVGPWPVIEGELDDLLWLIRDCRYFEFFLTDERSEWVVFDTHHNALVVAGALEEHARGIGSGLGKRRMPDGREE